MFTSLLYFRTCYSYLYFRRQFCETSFFASNNHWVLNDTKTCLIRTLALTTSAVFNGRLVSVLQSRNFIFFSYICPSYIIMLLKWKKREAVTGLYSFNGNIQRATRYHFWEMIAAVHDMCQWQTRYITEILVERITDSTRKFRIRAGEKNDKKQR